MSKNTNLSFLTDYITADITNGRIGINNASPAYAFDVTGIARTSTSTYLATASGNVGIGTTTPGYPLTVNGTVNAASFLSSTASPTIQINTWTTFYTMPAEVGIFSVIIGLGANDMATWYAYGTVFCNGASGVFLSSFNSTLVSLRTSGLNIQVLLGAGAGFARELTYKILRT